MPYPGSSTPPGSVSPSPAPQSSVMPQRQPRPSPQIKKPQPPSKPAADSQMKRTGFNATSNVAGPIPLGGLLALAGVNPANYMVNPNSNSNPNYRFSYGGVPTNAFNPDSELNTPFNKNNDQGLSQNLTVASQAKYPIIGIGNTAAQAFTPYRVTVAGQRVAIIAATQVIDEVVRKTPKAIELVQRSFLSQEAKSEYIGIVGRRQKLLSRR